MNIISIPVDPSGESTRIVRAGIFTVVFFLGGSLLWSALAPISSAVVAEGSIKVDTQRKTIQHLEGGLVRAILVHEGDHVESGQPLLVLEDAAVLSSLNVLKDQRDAELAREARLLAEKTMAREVGFPESLRVPGTAKRNALMHNEQSVFQVRRKSLDEEINVIRGEIHSAGLEETAVLSEIESALENIRYKEERLAAAIKLSERQYIQKEQLLTTREALSDKRQTLAQLRGRLASLKQHQSELELRIINLRNEYAKTADNDLKDARRSIFELEEKIRPVELVLNRSQIVAPIAGQVIDLRVTTVGGVVRPGDPLMDVVPDQKSLILEVRVKTTDVDKIFVGQLADVKLLAYNARQVPHVPGHVSYVSGDALRDQQAGGSRLAEYYLVHIQVDQVGLADLQKNYPDVIMTPGMPVTGFIQTRPRTFFQILLKPFLDSVSRGMRMET
jgi:HlyD family secretion protein/epimerase transport system membrane fusion protein